MLSLITTARQTHKRNLSKNTGLPGSFACTCDVYHRGRNSTHDGRDMSAPTIAFVCNPTVDSASGKRAGSGGKHLSHETESSCARIEALSIKIETKFIPHEAREGGQCRPHCSRVFKDTSYDRALTCHPTAIDHTYRWKQMKWVSSIRFCRTTQ